MYGGTVQLLYRNRRKLGYFNPVLYGYRCGRCQLWYRLFCPYQLFPDGAGGYLHEMQYRKLTCGEQGAGRKGLCPRDRLIFWHFVLPVPFRHGQGMA